MTNYRFTKRAHRAALTMWGVVLVALILTPAEVLSFWWTK